MKTNPPKQASHFLAAATLIVLLSACAANRAAAPAATTVPAAPAATQAPTATEASAATAAPAATDTAAAPAATDTAAPVAAEPTATIAAAAEMTATAETTATAAMTETAPAAASQGAVFKIDQSQSKVTFTLNEKLMGNPKTVVGTSTGIEGEITVDAANPAASKIGKITIDASQFATDSGMRDRAIKNFILQTSKAENQFITFEPTAIEGLPATVKAGEPVTFKVTGNLTIRGVSQPVTFETTVTQKSETELSGTAKTTVKRADFQLEIPRVPSVADVTDEVALELTFVAMKAA